jgi:hypothetical protein
MVMFAISAQAHSKKDTRRARVLKNGWEGASGASLYRARRDLEVARNFSSHLNLTKPYLYPNATHRPYSTAPTPRSPNGFKTTHPLPSLLGVIDAPTGVVKSVPRADLRMHIFHHHPIARTRTRHGRRRQAAMATDTAPHESSVSDTAAGKGRHLESQRGPQALG